MPLVFFLFLGVFIGVNGLPGFPFASMTEHDYLIGTNLAGVSNPDGLSVPTFGCYYACGRTVTCALWQIQAYIFPFWNSGHGWGCKLCPSRHRATCDSVWSSDTDVSYSRKNFLRMGLSFRSLFGLYQLDPQNIQDFVTKISPKKPVKKSGNLDT